MAVGVRLLIVRVVTMPRRRLNRKHSAQFGLSHREVGSIMNDVLAADSS